MHTQLIERINYETKKHGLLLALTAGVLLTTTPAYATQYAYASSSMACAFCEGPNAYVSVSASFSFGPRSKSNTTTDGYVSVALYADEYPDLGVMNTSSAVAWVNGVKVAEDNWSRA